MPPYRRPTVRDLQATRREAQEAIASLTRALADAVREKDAALHERDQWKRQAAAASSAAGALSTAWREEHGKREAAEAKTSEERIRRGEAGIAAEEAWYAQAATARLAKVSVYGPHVCGCVVICPRNDGHPGGEREKAHKVVLRLANYGTAGNEAWANPGCGDCGGTGVIA